MLAFDTVSWSVGGTRVLDAVSFAVEARRLAVLVGPSGAGKSTILRLAAGLLTPSTGVVSNASRRSAMVFQDPRLLPWESALDNAGLPLETLGVRRIEARGQAERWLLRLGLRREDLLKRPGELSGGMRARVAVARAFVTAPDLILLDEPFGALDLGLRRDLQGLTRRLVEETGVTALFVTHDLTEAVRLADRILVLDGRPGRITADFGQTPVEDLPEVWRAAADLSRRPEIAPVVAPLAEARPQEAPT